MTDDKPRRAGTVYGSRGERRRTPPKGLPPVSGAVPVAIVEPKARPITNVDMPIGDELAARIERTRSATKSSEIAITNRLAEQDQDTAKLRDEVSDIKDTVADMRVDVADIRGDVKGVAGAMAGLETVVRDLAERKQVTYVAGVNIQEAQAVAATQVDKTKAPAAEGTP